MSICSDIVHGLEEARRNEGGDEISELARRGKQYEGFYT